MVSCRDGVRSVQLILDVGCGITLLASNQGRSSRDDPLGFLTEIRAERGIEMHARWRIQYLANRELLKALSVGPFKAMPPSRENPPDRFDRMIVRLNCAGKDVTVPFE